MAEENEDGQEKTEEPSEKRLREAGDKGQVARSRELGTAVVFGAAVLALLGFGGAMAASAVAWLRGALTFAPRPATQDLPAYFGTELATAILMVLPLLAVCFVAAFVSPALLGGFHFSSEALKPTFSRLDPLAGLKRIYGREGLAEFLRSLLRVALIGGCALAGVVYAAPRLIALVHEPLPSAVIDGSWLVMRTLALMMLALILLAVLDTPYQLWSHRRRLMMTRQELRDELKETEGRPEVKSRIRRLQQQMSQRRMLEDVPRADVILVNPTHYAVALKYEAGRTKAPVLVAKGVDEIARIIRESGERHGVPVVSVPPLARALYRQVEIGREIPVNLYSAVAHILGYVYQLRTWRRQGGAMPHMPVIDVPDAEG